MATSTHTVKSVPDWAQEFVILYAERAKELSSSLGVEKQHVTTSTLIYSDIPPDVNAEYAYDNFPDTYAQIWSLGGINGDIRYSGFTSPTQTYTSLSLCVSARIVGLNPSVEGASVLWNIEYSLNGGSSWSYMAAYGPDTTYSWASVVVQGDGYTKYTETLRTHRVAISEGTDLSQVQIRFSTAGTDGVRCGFYIHEIYTYGTFATPEGTAGSLSAYSGPIFAAQNQDEIDGIAGLAVRGRYGDQVITKAIAYEDDVINSGHLAGTKAEFTSALGYVTGKSTTDWASVYSRIGRKPYYVGDSDSTYLAQTLTTGTPATYNARISAAIYADHFHKERDIQDHALGYGVEMGKHAAIDAETLRRAGLYQREYVQYGYVMTHKLFLEDMEMSVVNLEVFGNCLRALTGSQQTTTQEYSGGNKMTSAVGMGMAGGVAGWYIGAQIGSVGGPLGAAIGFVVGGVLGYVLS